MIILCTVILLLGVREYSFINIAMTLLNVVVILSIIGVGAWHFDRHKWTNFMGPGKAMGSLEGIFTGNLFFFVLSDSLLQPLEWHLRCS